MTIQTTLRSAGDLLDALGARAPTWGGSRADWIFRGQADSLWDLDPPVMRRGAAACKLLPYDPDRTHGAQINLERKLIHEFALSIDRQGLAPPSDRTFRWGSFAHEVGHLLSGQTGRIWPPDDAAPLFALAQHFGLPTRLLDWSDRPLVAAYFAAADACHRVREGEDPAGRSLSVWALCERKLAPIVDFPAEAPKPPRLRVIRPPRFSNPNLHAQSGVMTVVDDYLRHPEERAELPSLTAYVAARQDEAGNSDTVLRRLDLHWEFAEDLLRLLAQEGVDGATLFPGFEGAARSVRERRW